jgi:hypothetical protein
MRKVLALAIMGISLVACAETPSYGIQGIVALHTRGTKGGHRTELQGGANARWNLGDGHGALLQLNITRLEPTVGAYYTYHFEGQPVGYCNIIGITSSGLGFGVGYDFSRNFGLQTTFITGHNTIQMGAKFMF